MKIFRSHPFLEIQKEIGQSSWFGFSLIIKKNYRIPRDKILKNLKKNGIDVRPIIAGNIVEHKMSKYFNYKKFNTLKNANYLNRNGFFIGNSHNDLEKEILQTYRVLDQKFYL